MTKNCPHCAATNNESMPISIKLESTGAPFFFFLQSSPQVTRDNFLSI